MAIIYNSNWKGWSDVSDLGIEYRTYPRITKTQCARGMAMSHHVPNMKLLLLGGSKDLRGRYYVEKGAVD